MFHKLNPTVITCLIFLIAATQATAAFNNYSMLFDGTNEYIDCGDVLQINSATELTISGWFKQPTLDVTSWLLSKGNNDDYWISASTSINGGLYISVRNGGLTYSSFDYSTVVTAGVWFHYVMVYDGNGTGNSDKIKIYIDGNEVSLSIVGTWPTQAPDLTGESLTLGTTLNPTWINDKWNGNIDEVSIWNKALSSNEVSEIYNNGYPGNLSNHSAETNLVSWWRMGDGATWTTSWSIPDDSTNSNTGISVNMEEADRRTDALSPPIPSGTTFMAR